MAKWEDLPVPVDEDVEREKAEVRANYEIWGKRVRTQVLGRLLLGMSGLFALHGYISFCIATDPVIAWGPEWMASDQFLGFCAILLPIGLIVALAALIGIWKNARMEHNKALYFSGLALTIIGTFAPFVSGLWLHTDWIFKLSFTTAPEFVGIMLVVAAFMREIGSDAESKRLAWLMALLYGLAATASIAVGGRAIAVGGLLVVSLWLSAAFATYLLYLAANGRVMPWRWTAIPREGRWDTIAATVAVVCMLVTIGGLAGSQLISSNLEIISALPSDNGYVDVVTINEGGWPVEGEIVLYSESNGTLTELARTGKVVGFGRWLAHIDAVEAGEHGGNLVLYRDGELESRSYVGAGEYVCSVMYPMAILVAAAVCVMRARRKGRLDS